MKLRIILKPHHELLVEYNRLIAILNSPILAQYHAVQN